jgi:putative hydrolase of the HAD superfamily
MLKAITFDFWGTIVDARHSLRRRRSQILAAYLGQDEETVVAAYSRAWDDFSAGIEQGYGLPPQTVLSATLDLLGAALSPPEFLAVKRHWAELLLTEQPPLLGGVHQVLRELRRRGLWLGLISDTGTTPGTTIRACLRSQGLLTYFDWLTFSDEMGVTKRRPQAFWATVRALGVPPREALHVGDLPGTDIQGARAAGLYTALVLESTNHREAIPDADIVLERLAELPDKLDIWLATRAEDGGL